MNEFELSDYVPIVLMFVVAIGFAGSQVLVTQLVGPRKRTATKLMPYECGKDPVGSARDRFSIKFYTVAVVFLLFDIEVLFMIPFAVAFKTFLVNESAGPVAYATVALIEILAFIATFIAAYIYVWKKGVFDWGTQARIEARAESHDLLNKKKQRILELKGAA